MNIMQSNIQKLNIDIEKLALQVKHHEDNLAFLMTQINNVDVSILDKNVELAKLRSSEHVVDKGNKVPVVNTEKQTNEQILQLGNTAAAIICQMDIYRGLASNIPVTKDVIGIVATLGKVTDRNLSRLLSEFLGLETMLAVVCKTYKGVKALEQFNVDGNIDKSTGLHGLGLTVGRCLKGRFSVICLENLRPYAGDLLPGDPERYLDLLKPKLPNGRCPSGFCGFAVNMINLDPMHTSCLTASGHGLRETLFYSLFSRVQVYETRAQLEAALPLISHGAISLDGGILRSSGFFLLGERTDIEVQFPIDFGRPNRPAKLIETEDQLKLLNWKKERLSEDVKREEALVKHAKQSYFAKSNELMELLKASRGRSF